MSFTSNQLRQAGRLLANKPMNEQGEVFKINGNTPSGKNYALSLEEYNKLVSEIRSALNDHNHVIHDDKLRLIIDTIMKHCFELFQKKTRVANVDASSVGSVLSCSTGERNLWWMGGFRPSKLLQVIMPQLQHLCTHQQLSDIYNLGNSCEQAEDALAQGMINLQQLLHEATTEGNKGFQLTCATDQQVSFFKQADNLRREFLHQFSLLFTISQQTEFLLAVGKNLHNPYPRSSL